MDPTSSEDVTDDAPAIRSMPALDDILDDDTDLVRELEKRTAALEKKIYDQNDEIVCLRSTLADALRRIALLETARGQSPLPSKGLLGRTRSGQGVDSPTNGQSSMGPSPVPRNVPLRPGSTPGSHSANRRSMVYQSTGSLASESPVSSNSVSPAPSPFPSQTHQGVQLRERDHGGANYARHSAGPGNGLVHPANSITPVNNFQTAKRWSSTSDFALNNHGSRRLEFNSLLNLSSRNAGGNPGLRSVVRDPVYNPADGSIKFYLRGRPIVTYVPSPLVDSYKFQTGPTPQAKLKMEWIYGYRGKDCRSNLHLLPTGEVVYFVAAVVVLFNIEEMQQRHYLGHTSEVKCLVVHPNKLLVASGQATGHDRKDGRAHIRIWNSVSLQTAYVIGLGDFDKSIACLAFSKGDGGNLLVAVSEAPDQTLSLWDWQRGEKGNKITETKCSSELVVAVEFHPIDRYSFVSCGKGHVCFWSLENGTISRKLGIFESRNKPKYVTCLAFADNGDVLTGDSHGTIFIWSRGSNVVHKIVRNAHEGPIFSLLTLKDGSIVSGGGKDGQLVLWDPTYRRTGYVAELPDKAGSVRTLIQGKGSQILVGTTRNCILVGNFDLPFRVLVAGHTDELWSLCAHPTQHQFLSGGHDKLIQLWDSMSHTLIWSKEMSDAIHSACFSPDGSVLILGTLTGKWMAMGSETREIYTAHFDGTEPIQVVKFSPSGKTLALGSRDGIIYIYSVSDNYRKYTRMGRCLGHSSFVTHMDWAKDSALLQTNSGDYETLFWNTEICRQVNQPSQLRDVEWSSTSCTLNFATFGVWPEGADGTDVNCVSASNSRQLLVSGDDFGRVKVFNYPASQPKAAFLSYPGHGSHVTGVCFLHDDRRVLSVGGRDSAIIQWAVQGGEL